MSPALSKWSPYLLGAALFVGAAAAGFAPSSDGDVWWHLAAGREMVRTGALLLTDPFSVSALGRAWPDVHWLFQLGTYAVHQLGGLRALVLVKCALLGVSAMILFAALKPRGAARALFVPLFLGAVFAARSLLLVRPVMVTLLFLALFFWVLERHRQGGRARVLGWLPVLQIVWVNCQGLSALGPALIAAYAIGAASSLLGERSWLPFAAEAEVGRAAVPLRPLFTSLAVCMAASFATPYGLQAVALPGKLLGRLLPHAGNVYASNIAENVPPLWLDQLNPGQFTHFKWYLGLLAVCFAVSAGRMIVSHALVLAGFVLLALFANRNVLLLYFIAAPIVALNLGAAFDRLQDNAAAGRITRFAGVAGAVAVVACLVGISAAAWREPSLGEPTPFRMPIESARIIAALPGEGAIFSADHQGGYLAWQLYPRFRPFMDTRLVLRTPEEFADYLAVADDPARFDDLQERTGFSYVVLPTAYPDRYLRVIGHLYRSAAWRLVYTDGAEVLFARRPAGAGDDVAWDLGDHATIEHIVASAKVRFAGWPALREAARMQLATLTLAVGEYAACEDALGGERAHAEDALRARCRLASGGLDGARALAEELVGEDANNVNGLAMLAMVHARRGDARQATGFLRRALAIDPFDVEATSLLASMEERQHANR